MAVIPGAPIAMNAPGTYQVPYPGGGTTPQGGHQWTQLKLENASPFALTVLLGGTPVYSLPAGVADVFPLTFGPAGLGSTGVDASPAQLISVVVTGPVTPGAVGTLRPSFGQYGDLFPGAYPLSLSPWNVSATPAFNTQVFGGRTSVSPGGGSNPILVTPTQNYTVTAAWLAVSAGTAGQMWIEIGTGGAGLYILMAVVTSTLDANVSISFPAGCPVAAGTPLTLSSNGPGGYGGAMCTFTPF